MLKERNPVGSIHLNESLRYTGGAEGYILHLAQALDRRNIPARLVTGWREEVHSPELSYFIPGVHKRVSSSEMDTNLEALGKIMSESGLEVVHLHNVDSPVLYERLVEDYPTVRTVIDSRPVCPLEFRINDLGEICELPISDRCINCSHGALTEKDLQRKYETLTGLVGLDLLIVPSEYTKSQLSLNGIPQEKIKIIPLFIPHDLPNPTETEERYASDILFVGRINQAKGVRLALKIFSKISGHVRFTICGNGPDLIECQRLVEELGVSERVLFTGWIESEDRARYFANTKVVLFPSMSPESFGLVGLEAMYYRKPVVGFNSGGVSAWLRNGENGYLVPTGDKKGMADRVEYLLQNQRQREQLGENGKNILNTEFTADNHIHAIMGVYNQIIERRGLAG